MTTSSTAPVAAVFDQQALAQLRQPARALRAPRGAVVPVFAATFFQALEHRAGAPVPAAGSTTAAGTAQAAAPAVLVVDDDASIRTVVQAALADEGYAVLAAPDGQAALALVAQRQPRVVLLDMNMPGMDGPAFCDQLAAQAPHPRPAIVVMTASSQAAAFQAHCQADDQLGKPFELTDLYAVVERQLTPV